MIRSCKRCRRRTEHYPTGRCKPCLKRWQAANKERRARSVRLWKNEHRYAAAYSGTKIRAARKGLAFTLTPKDVQRILAGERCVYCGIQTVHSPHSGGDGRDSPTLDRLLPSRGYTPTNTVLACASCNRQKSDMTAADMRRLADKVDVLVRRLAALRRDDS